MNLTELYNLSEKNNIDIENWKMKKTKARIISNEDTCIFVDYSQIHSYIEEKEILAEEFGHYKYEAYYTLLSDKNFIDKQEYKAQKWKALNLCPLNSILSLFKKRNNKFIDIADNLQITPKTAQFAISYYYNNGLLKTDADFGINF